MKEIKVGFLRGIGYFLSCIFISFILGLISIIIFYIFIIPKRKCISWNYQNDKKVCAKYEYK